jgi:phenylalanyl-tRNA synthetase alpha chain
MASASIPEKDQLAAALAEGLSSISSSSSSDDLRTLMSTLTGKKGAIATVKGSLGKVADIEARKELGQAVNEALNSLQRASDLRSRELRTGEFATQINADRVDMTELAMSAQASQRRGRMHLVTQATERLEDVFIGLGFQMLKALKLKQTFITSKHSTCRLAILRAVCGTHCSLKVTNLAVLF